MPYTSSAKAGSMSSRPRMCSDNGRCAMIVFARPSYVPPPER